MIWRRRLNDIDYNQDGFQSNPGEVENAVKVAVKAGYRLIDTAQGYENEEEIGNALQVIKIEIET